MSSGSAIELASRAKTPKQKSGRSHTPMGLHGSGRQQGVGATGVVTVLCMKQTIAPVRGIFVLSAFDG